MSGPSQLLGPLIFSALSTLLLPSHWLPDAYRRLFVGLFFGLVIVLGLWRAPDFGSFTDEDSCRESGQISLVYLYGLVPPGWLPQRAANRLTATNNQNRLENYVDRDYGVAFELPVAVLEKLTGYTDMGDVVRLRHRCVWLVCCAGLIAFYWLATQRLQSWRAGLFGATLLLLSPRQLCDFFYNSKDAVFLACYLVATATAVAFLQRPTRKRAFWHALACALTCDVRIMGILVPVLTVAFLGFRGLHGDYRGQWLGKPLLFFAGLLPLFIVAFWPYLWAAPITRFWQTWLNMSHFRWYGTMLYAGQVLSTYTPTPLPWHYALTWASITTPVLYLVGLAIAFGLLVRQLIRRGGRLYKGEGEWQDLLFWGLGAGPFLAIIALHAVVYNGWRQLYFAYPPLLLLALQGLLASWHWQPWNAVRAWWQPAVAFTVAISLVSVASKIAQLHPLENLYFNTLAGAHPELRYEYDYWGLGSRQGLQWIVRHDTRSTIRVSTNMYATCFFAYNLLPPAERKRLLLSRQPNKLTDYSLQSFYAESRGHAEVGTLVYSLRVEEEQRRVLDIYRLRQPVVLTPAN